jgi:regulator of nucleoside diphosphate kinase
MARRNIIVTNADRQRLGTVLERARQQGLQRRRLLDDLEHELERAEVVDQAEVPADVITMNSTAILTDLETGEKHEYTLVYPSGAYADEGRISILAPVGTAMIGYRVGDVIDWPVPAGRVRLQVDEVLYQPERVGVLDR